MTRAWVSGAAVLLFVDIAWVLTMWAETFSGALLLVAQVSPFFAALISAYMAPRKRFLVGLSMAVPAAALVVGVTIAFQLAGIQVDFPGSRGAQILFLVTLAYSAVVCAAGAGLGGFLRRGGTTRAVDH